MKRSRYFDDMLVSALQLNWGEQTKVEGILERITALIQKGVLSGLRLGGTGSTTLRIGIGLGMTLTGEVIKIIDEKTYSTAGLSPGIWFVHLKYKEVLDPNSKVPLYGGGLSPETKVLDDCEVILDTNIHNVVDEILVGIIKIGTGGVISEIIADSGSEVFKVPMSITQPTTILGCWVVNVGYNLDVGYGTLELNKIGMQYRMRWKPPGQNFGSYVNVSSDGDFTLQGEMAGSFIIVRVIYALLPVLGDGETKTEDLRVFNIYDRVSKGNLVDKFSGTDTLHRSFVGSGLLTEKNPHGLTLQDLGERIEALLPERVTGIWKGSSKNYLKVKKLNNTTIEIQTPVGNDFYIIGGKILKVFTPTVFNLEDLYGGYDVFLVIDIFINERGELQTILKAQYEVDRNYDSVYLTRLEQGVPAGNFKLGYRTNVGIFQICFAKKDETDPLWKDVPVGYNGYMILTNKDGFSIRVRILNTDGWPASEVWDNLTVYSSIDELGNLLLAELVFDKESAIPNILEIYDLRQFGTTGKWFLKEDIISDLDWSNAEGFLEGMLAKIFTDGVIKGLKPIKKDVNKINIENGEFVLKGRKIKTPSLEIDVSDKSDELWWIVFVEKSPEAGGEWEWQVVTSVKDLIKGKVGKYGLPLGYVEVCSFIKSGNQIIQLFDERKAVGLKSGWGSVPIPIKECLFGDTDRNIKIYKTSQNEISLVFGVRWENGEWRCEEDIDKNVILIQYSVDPHAYRIYVAPSTGRGNLVVWDELAVSFLKTGMDVKGSLDVNNTALLNVYDSVNRVSTQACFRDSGGVISAIRSVRDLGGDKSNEVHISKDDRSIYAISKNQGVGTVVVEGKLDTGISDDSIYGLLGWWRPSPSEIKVGVYGYAKSGDDITPIGVFGRASGAGKRTGVQGVADGPGGVGVAGDGETGIRGKSSSYIGYGVLGENVVGGIGIRGDGSCGVYGWGTDYGIYGFALDANSYGVYGRAMGQNSFGVYGEVEKPNSFAIYGYGPEATQYAGYFNGRVHIEGDLTVSGNKSFEIDHPIKKDWILRHACLEGPGIFVFYHGRGKLVNGQAKISLPDYFEALTSPDGREVFVSCIGGFSPLKVSKIKNGSFSVELLGDGNPEQEFSWLVLAIRNDEYIRKNPFKVEEEKLK